MDFHPLKCKVLKMGRTIADLYDIFHPYTLRQQQLEVVDHEKDLGVTMDFDLIFYKHVSNNIDLHIKHRLHLEYANSFWAPRFKRQVEVIENVQRRATRLMPGFKDLTYEEKIRKLSICAYTKISGLPLLTWFNFNPSMDK